MINRFMTEETYEGIQKAMHDYQVERVKTLRKAGYSCKEVAETLGLSETEVRTIRLD